MSTNPFDIDARTLERHEGVSTVATGRWAVEAQKPVIPKRFIEAYVKRSAHRMVVGENKDRWEQEAYEELIRQHPWINAFAIKTKMTATDSDGYAVGFFHLSAREVPQTLASEETLNIVTVPIIIRDFKLYPFDVFSFKESLYPMTEDRVVQTLRMRDIFTEVDRERFRYNLNRQDNPMSMREMGQPSYLRDPFKHSGDRSLEDLVGAWTSIPNIEVPGEETKLPLDAKERVFKESAAPAAVRVQIRPDVATYDVAWASDPDTGLRSREDAVAVRVEKIASLFGDDVLRDALRDGSVVLNQNPEDTAAVVQNLGLDAAAPIEKVSAAWTSMMKTSKACGAMYQRIAVTTKDGDDHVYYGVPLNCYSAVTESSPFKSQGLLGWVMPTGKIVCHDFRESCFAKAPELSSYIPGDLRSELPDTLSPNGFCHYNDAKSEGIRVMEFGAPSFDSADCLYVWEQDSSFFAVGCRDHEIKTEEGDTACPSVHKGFDEVVVCEGLRRACVKLYGSTRRLYIPERAWKVGTNCCIREGQPLHAVLPAPSASDDTITNPTPLEHLKYHLKLSFDGRKYHVSSEDAYDEPPVVGFRDDAEFELAARGCPPRIAAAALKTSTSRVNEPVHLRYNRPHFDAGAEVYRKVSKILSKKLSSVRQDAQKLQAMRDSYFRNVESPLQRLKQSSPQSSPAVDTVLHLNFLTEKNLLRFVDLIPQLEKSMSALCAMLLASRMGLEEIKDSDVEASIDGLDSILSGLRVIEFSLANT